MYTEYSTFSKIMAATASVCQAWEEQIKDFTTIARELTRKRNEKFIPIKINASHLELKERCEYLKGFRKQHEQLRIMTGRDQGISTIDLGGGPVGEWRGDVAQLSGLTDLDMEDEVRAAYESVKNVEVLDTTPGRSQSCSGTFTWSNVMVADPIFSENRWHANLDHRRSCLQRTSCTRGKPDYL